MVPASTKGANLPLHEAPKIPTTRKDAFARDGSRIHGKGAAFVQPVQKGSRHSRDGPHAMGRDVQPDVRIARAIGKAGPEMFTRLEKADLFDLPVASFNEKPRDRRSRKASSDDDNS